MGLPIYAFYSYFGPSKELILIFLLFFYALSYFCSTLHDCVFLPLCFTFIFVLFKQAYKTVFIYVCFVILIVYFLPSCSPVFLLFPADLLPSLTTSSASVQHTHIHMPLRLDAVFEGEHAMFIFPPSFPLVFPLFSLDDFLNYRASFLLPALSSSVLSQFPCFYLLWA